MCRRSGPARPASGHDAVDDALHETVLRRQVAASPLAGPVGALSTDQLRALTREVVVAMAPFADDDGITWPLETLSAVAILGD